MFGIGTNELIIIFLIILLLFGASRIPEIGKALGRGIRDFKRATRDVERDLRVDDEEERRISGTSEGEHAKPQGTKEKTN